MKKLLLKILLIFVLVYSADYSFSKLLDYGMPADYRAFINSKKQYSEPDILVIGDSFIADAVIPSVIKQKTGMECFNFGVYHSSPVEQYFLLKDILARTNNKIKKVIIGLNPGMFSRELNVGEYSLEFIKNPVYKLSLILSTNSGNFSILSFSGHKIYLMKSLIAKVFNKQEPELKRNIEKTENGYLKNIKHYSKPEELGNYWKESYTTPVNNKQVQYFIDMIKLLKEKNIEVIIVKTPVHNNVYNKISKTKVFRNFHFIIDKITDVLKIKQYGTFEIHNNEYNDTDFLDGQHLCYTGAYKYSNKLGSFLTQNK